MRSTKSLVLGLAAVAAIGLGTSAWAVPTIIADGADAAAVDGAVVAGWNVNAVNYGGDNTLISLNAGPATDLATLFGGAPSILPGTDPNEYIARFSSANVPFIVDVTHTIFGNPSQLNTLVTFTKTASTTGAPLNLTVGVQEVAAWTVNGSVADDTLPAANPSGLGYTQSDATASLTETIQGLGPTALANPSVTPSGNNVISAFTFVLDADGTSLIDDSAAYVKQRAIGAPTAVIPEPISAFLGIIGLSVLGGSVLRRTQHS